jgi:hypothetical protein
MSEYADLELSLFRRHSGRYAIELRYDQPGSDADIRLLRDSTRPVAFDLAELRSRALDPVAYGRCLSASLFADPAVSSAFAQAQHNAQSLGFPLRLRLFFSPNAAELHNLRWETLRDPSDDLPLATNSQVLLSRYLSSGDWRPVRLRPKGELRTLVVVANPSDLADYQLAPINVAALLQHIKTSLSDVAIVTLGSGGTATFEALMHNLRDGVDILCLVAHGSLVENEPWLWLEQADGTAVRVSGDELALRLQELPNRPRLAVLASCYGGGSGESGDGVDDTMLALGPRMAEAGVPAVLAFQGQTSIETMGRFLPAFFAELLEDGQIDRAVMAARSAIADQPDVWTPVLFQRLKSGRIWYTPGFAGDSFGKWPTLLRSIEQGRCTPILGGGLVEALFGSPREIARRWAEMYHFPLAPHARDDLPQVAQYLAVEQDQSFLYSELSDSLQAELLRRFGKELSTAETQGDLNAVLEAAGARLRAKHRTEPHRVLAELPFPIYLTTNPDPLLPQALTAVGKEPSVVLCPWNEFVGRTQADYRGAPTPEKPLVYHLFGQISNSDSLALTEDDYFRYLIGITRNAELVPPVVLRALSDTSLLFLGFRLEDWNFRVLFQSLINQQGSRRRRHYTHVAVQIDPEEERILEPARARRYLEHYFGGVDISIYWGSAADFIRELWEKTAKLRAGTAERAVAAWHEEGQ